MNTLTKLLLITLPMLLISGTSLARDYQRHSGISHGYSNNYSGANLGYSNNHNYRHNNRSYVPRYSHEPYSDHKYRRSHSYRNDSYNKNKRHLGLQRNSYSTNHYRKSCHPTSRIIVDRHGYEKKIGGTMCYDSHGQAYIAESSRYLKH